VPLHAPGSAWPRASEVCVRPWLRASDRRPPTPTPGSHFLLSCLAVCLSRCPPKQHCDLSFAPIIRAAYFKNLGANPPASPRRPPVPTENPSGSTPSDRTTSTFLDHLDHLDHLPDPQDGPLAVFLSITCHRWPRHDVHPQRSTHTSALPPGPSALIAFPITDPRTSITRPTPTIPRSPDPHFRRQHRPPYSKEAAEEAA
jgi:hypothetical protein